MKRPIGGFAVALLLACLPASAVGWNVQLNTIKPESTVTAPSPSPSPNFPIKPATPEPPEPEPLSGYAGAFRATHSSHLDDNIYPVDAGRAADGDKSTAWCEGAEGDGIGEWIELVLPDGRKRMLKGFKIINGYAKSEDVFQKNNRVKNLDLLVDGVLAESFTLEDSMDWQTFTLVKPMAGAAFRLVIRSVYAGSRYQDTCISEIGLY